MYVYMCESLIWSHKSLIDSDLHTIKEPGLNSTYLLVFDVSIWTVPRSHELPGNLGGMTKRYQNWSALRRQIRTGARLFVFWGHFLGWNLIFFKIREIFVRWDWDKMTYGGWVWVYCCGIIIHSWRSSFVRGESTSLRCWVI